MWINVKKLNQKISLDISYLSKAPHKLLIIKVKRDCQVVFFENPQVQ